MAEAFAGTVEVRVTPDTSGFARDLERGVVPQSARVGQQAGDVMGQAMGRAVASQVRDAMRGIDVATVGARAGREFGRAFAATANAQIKSALRDQKVRVDADTSAASRNVNQLQLKLDGLDGASVRVDADTAGASAKLSKVSAQAGRLDGDTVNIDVDADTSRATAGLFAIQGAASGAVPSVSMLATALVAIAPAAVPIAAVAVGSIAAVGVAAVAAAGGVGVLALAIAPVVGAVQALTKAADQSGQATAGAGRSQLQMASASDGLRSAQRSLASAIQSARDQEIKSAQQIADATRALASAKRDAAAEEAQAARRVEDARRELADAKRDAADDEARAARQVEDAERSLANAQRDFLDAQLAVNEARRQAAEDLEDLQSRLANAVLDEEAAQIRLAEARARADEAERDPKITELERRKAVLAYQEATQALADQERELARLQAAQQEADRAGVEGSDAVIQARKRVTQSQQGVRDAERGVSDASKESGRQQQDSARKIAEAQRGVGDAVAAARDAHVKGAEKIAAAERALAEAVRSSAVQQRQAADSVASAQQAVVAAQRGIEQASVSAGSAGGAAMADLQKKMAALSPAGRSFALFIANELLPQLRGISKVAQEGFLPGFEQGIRSMIPSLSGFTAWVGRMASELGVLAAAAGRALAGPWWQDFFRWLGSTATATIGTFARTLGNLSQGFAGLFRAFAPTGIGLGNALEDLSEKFAAFGRSAQSNEAVQGILAYIRTTGPVVAQTLGSIARAFVAITEALAPIGPVTLRLIGTMANLIAAMPPWAIQAAVIGFVALSTSLSVLGTVAGIVTAPLMAVTVTIGTLTVSLGVVIGVVAAVVAALAVLAVAVVQMYQHWGVFRMVVDAVCSGIATAVSTMWTAVGSVFGTIVAYLRDTLGPMFTWLRANVIGPVFSALGSIISAWWTVVRGVFNLVVAYVRNILVPVFNATLRPYVEVSFSLIVTAIKLAWSVMQVIFAAIRTGVQGLAWIFQWLYTNIIQPTWNYISSHISSVWNSGIKPAFQAFTDFVTKNVAPPFKAAVGIIKAAWEDISNVAKAPVRFLVNTVINEGIIDTWNSVAGWFGVDPVPRVKLPKGFATGGRVTGPGTGTSDSILARLSTGEYVLRASAVKALGVDFLDLLNQAGTGKVNISGDVARTTIRRGFAEGGIVQQVRDWLPSVDPLPYIWGGVGPGGYDCSGLAGEVFNRLTGRTSYRRAFTTESNFGALGFKRGTGMYTIGVSRNSAIRGGHMVGNLASLPFEAKGSQYGIFVGKGARSVMSLPEQWYLENLGPGGSISGGPPGFDYKNPLGWVRAKISHYMDKLKEIADNPFGRLISAVPRRMFSAVMSKLKGALSIIPGFSRGGLVEYDTGGWLPPGVSTVVNNTGRPEPILTAQQWDQVRQGATVNVTVTNPVPETASESTTRMMRRLAAVGMFG